ncbi:MAG: lipoyl(octanoyl) transferase LipB [Anaerolineae bacterium]
MAIPVDRARTQKTVSVLDLGRSAYGHVHALQVQAVECVRESQTGEVIILVEHSPTITLGRRGDAANILADPEKLADLGIEVHRIERGGDVTYHGPGQLVVYPILRLHEYVAGASDYMHRLEEVVIRTLSDFGIQAGRRPGLIGVWVGHDKVCALGVRIRAGVTMHGLALNVDPNMGHWETIVPCGIHDGGVTSMRALLGAAPGMGAVKECMLARFAEAFGVQLAPVDDASCWALDGPRAGGPPPA